MKPSDPPEDDDRLDALLRAAMRGASDEAPEAETIDDGALRAWRSGALDEAGAAAVEGALAASAEDRALARASAEPVDPALVQWAEARWRAEQRAPTRAWRWSGLALAAAALLAVGAAMLLRGPEAPAYVASPLMGGASDLRSDATPHAGPPAFRAGGVLRVVLRPPVAGEAPAVAVYVARPGAALRAVPAEVSVADGGAVTVEAPARALFAEPGDWRLYVALGDAPADPGAPFDEVRAQSPAAQWFEFPLIYAPVDPEGGPP